MRHPDQLAEKTCRTWEGFVELLISGDLIVAVDTEAIKNKKEKDGQPHAKEFHQ